MTREAFLEYFDSEMKALNRLLAEMQAVLDRRAALRELPRIVPSQSKEVN